ncbi:hypothetical protein C8Q75DRAFT_125427 [Abortiporus biennis]|nr:hypothetical protein C8Q75DRAFT_125427 [Abortiporus biennis]
MRTHIPPIILLILNSFLAPLWAVPLPELASSKPEVHISMEHDGHIPPMFHMTYSSDFQPVELHQRSRLPNVPMITAKAICKFGKAVDKAFVHNIPSMVSGPVEIVKKGAQNAHNVRHAITTGVKKMMG